MRILGSARQTYIVASNRRQITQSSFINQLELGSRMHRNVKARGNGELPLVCKAGNLSTPERCHSVKREILTPLKLNQALFVTAVSRFREIV